ncbi:MAG: class I SAM-dependent methyltransferase [Actinomycetota bacterium]
MAEIEDRKTRWVKQWDRPEDAPFHWKSKEPHHALRDLLPGLDVPAGAALDLGCGDGIAARHLADRFTPSVGIDFAPGAIVQAVADAASEGSPAIFAVGDVTKPPFPDGSFTFLFDRGCFHTLPPPLRKPFFDAMELLLAPGGYFYLMASREFLHKATSRRGLRQRINRTLRPGRKLRWPQEDEIRRLTPTSFEIVSFDREKYYNPLGTVMFNRFLFRKRT